jgi:uncharacterized protein YjbI with pentapeptide repeats
MQTFKAPIVKKVSRIFHRLIDSIVHNKFLSWSCLALFQKAILTNANFRQANLSNAKVQEADFRNVIPSHTHSLCTFFSNKMMLISSWLFDGNRQKE